MVKLLEEINKPNLEVQEVPTEVRDSNSEECNRPEGNNSSEPEGNATPGPTAMSSSSSQCQVATLPVQDDVQTPVTDEQRAPEPTPVTDEQKAPEPTPSTTTNEESASAVKFNKEEIEKFIASRRMQKQDKKQSENLGLELSYSEVATLVQLIACQMCDKIPFPDCRYYCESGHIYCSRCMIEQYKRNQGTCSIRILRQEYKTHLEFEELVAANCEWMDDKEKIKFPRNEDLSDDVLIKCGGKISYSLDHPLVNHLFNSVVWNCPMKKLGCFAAVNGENLPRHIMKCLKLRIMKQA